MPSARQRRASRKQEEKLAQRFGGRAQPGSGRVAGCKGDVRVLGRFRLEAKYTSKASFSLRLADLRKIASECAGRERPLFVVEFKADYNLQTGLSFAVVPLNHWEELPRRDTAAYKPTREDTPNKSFTLHLADLLQLVSDCAGRERPLLLLEFKREEELGASYAIVLLDHWEELINKDANKNRAP